MLGKVHDGPFLSGNHVGDITTQLPFVVFELPTKQDREGRKRCLTFQKEKKAVRLSLQGWVD